jgi:hypothetical protein
MDLKLVYTHPSIVMVTQSASALERSGIEPVIRNEYSAGAVGELAPIDAWPELWVRAKDWEAAERAIKQSNSDLDKPDWTCTQCGKSNPDTFEFCWGCANER